MLTAPSVLHRGWRAAQRVDGSPPPSPLSPRSAIPILELPIGPHTGATWHACQLRAHSESPPGLTPSAPLAVCSWLPRASTATPRTGWDSGSAKSLRRGTGLHTQVQPAYNKPPCTTSCESQCIYYVKRPISSHPQRRRTTRSWTGWWRCWDSPSPSASSPRWAECAARVAECELRWSPVVGPGVPVGILRAHLGSPQPHPPGQPGSAEHSPHPLGPPTGTLHPAQVGPPPT